MSNAKLMMVCLVAAMGGLLFGYDWVVIGGAKPFYEPYLGIAGDANAWRAGFAMSSAVLGCIAGAVGLGWFPDRFGRKPSLVVAAVFFTVSAVWTAAVTGYWAFIAARVLGGLGIGLASNVSPIYIAEVSPPEARGRLVSVNQLTIVLGIILAQLVNYIVFRTVAADAWKWRVMFGAEAVPAGLFLALAFFIPESPRWRGRGVPAAPQDRNAAPQNADAAGTRAAPQDRNAAPQNADTAGTRAAPQDRNAAPQNADTAGTRAASQGAIGTRVWAAVALGVFLAAFQQWCGINVVFNYAEEIFKAAGYDVSGVMFNQVITGVVNFAFTIVAMCLVDRWGRRPLMLLGAGGLAALYTILGCCYFFGVKGVAVLVVVMAAIACYAMTLAPITWVVLSEIFPDRVRGNAMAVSVAALWMSCFGLTLTFKPINAALGASGTFWLYAAICVAGFAVVALFLRETKGRDLE